MACGYLRGGLLLWPFPVGSGQGAWHHPSGSLGPLPWLLSGHCFFRDRTCFAAAWKTLGVTRVPTARARTGPCAGQWPHCSPLGAAHGFVLTSSPAFPCLTFVPDWSRALWLAQCPLPRPPVCTRKCFGSGERFAGSLRSEQGLHNGPLCAGTFLLKQAQIQAALASTPMGRADRKVRLWGGGGASGAAEPVGLMDLERAGLWGGTGLARIGIPSLPCSQPGLFKNSVDGFVP